MSMENSHGIPVTRAGHYATHGSGLRTFVPASLPPDPPVSVDQDLQRQLSEADSELGRLEGSVTTLPNLFVLMYVRKEAVLSSQIEGTQSSLRDLLAAEAQVLSPDRPKDVKEVVNYVAALNFGLERLAELPVSVRLIREIHERLLANTRGAHAAPGELRRSQNWIGPQGCTPSEAMFVPPAPHDVAPALAELENFLHHDETLPLLLRIGIAHAHFETVHPFLDGNGRVGRLLITLLLCEHSKLSKPVLYLSYYFKRHRTEYYERLQRIRDAGDWEGWLSFFLQGVAEVSRDAADTARKILLLREQHRTEIVEHFGRTAGNGQRVLERLYATPFVSVNEVKEITGTSYATANDLVRRLERIGVLHEFTGQKRNRRFWYAPYVELFMDPHLTGQLIQHDP